MNHLTTTIALATGLFGLGGSASAQALTQAISPAEVPVDPPSVTTMSVDIWPEYDDPRVLVIYAGRMDPSVDIPTEIRLVIPEGAQVHMAGFVDAEGTRRQSPFQIRDLGDGRAELDYSLASSDFYVEFYYNPFSGGESRSFTYPVVPPGDVGRLVVSVQQPLRAEGFQVSPFTTQVVQDGQGMLYHVIEEDSLTAAGSVTPISVSYRKQDREPSVAPAQATPAARTSDGGTMTNVLALVAVLLVGVGAYALFFTSRRRDKDDYLATIRTRTRPTQHDSPARYCTACGDAVAPVDRYCSSCGHATQPPDVIAART